MVRWLLIAGILTMTARSAVPETYLIRPDGTGDFATIQAALDAVAEGDVIELSDGTFTGDGNRDLDFLGKAITVRSQSGNPEACLIDCQGSPGEPHRGFGFRSGEQNTSQLLGITITGGCPAADAWGGAILCEAASDPRIADCTLCRNRGTALHCIGESAPRVHGCRFLANEGNEAGAVLCEVSSPSFEACEFVDNTALWYAGAFCGAASSARFDACTFRGNLAPAAGAVEVYYGSDPLFRDCLFVQNASSQNGAAAAMFFCFVSGTMEQCTFASNTTGSRGCVVGTGKMSHITLSACTFWNNDVPNGAVVAVGEIDGVLENTLIAFNTGGCAAGGEHPIELSCCDLFGNQGGDWVGPIADQFGVRGNISADPLLCDPQQGDFHLDCASPCAPFSAPNPECDRIGAWPVGCGASPPRASTWGALKQLFGP